MQNFVLWSFVFILSCSTSVKKSIPASSIKSQILHHEVEPQFNEHLIRQKISQFKLALKDGKLSESELKLHDELLNDYIQLKQDQNIIVKAHSSKEFLVDSFCLDSSKPAPEANEKFAWIKKNPEITFFEELIKYSKTHLDSQENIQTIIWNLGNKTYFENYPENLQQILKSIDPNVSIKLPSKLKDTLKDAILDNIPGVSDLKDDLQLIQGEYYQYQDIRDQIQKLKSNYSLDTEDSPEEIQDSTLFAKTESDGYKTQKITIYNPTDEDQILDLSEYHLEPRRADVQRIGFGSRKNELQKNNLIDELENILFKDMLRLGIGFTPGLNDVVDIYELLTGKEFISGSELSWQDRMLSGVGLIAGSGSGYRYAKRAVNSPAEYLPEFEKGLAKSSGKNVKYSQTEAKSSMDTLKHSGNTASENKDVIKGWKKNHKITSIKDADEANRDFPQGYNKPPFKSGTKVIEFETKSNEKWVRVHGDKNKEGPWMMKEEAIHGLRAEQIKHKYSLPEKPTHVSDVMVPQGKKMYRGKVGENYEGGEGAVQYYSKDRLPNSSFINTRGLNK